MTDVLGLGNLLLEMTLFFALLIVVFEWLEVQRAGKRERRLLDEIEREYEAYCRMGRL
jgi:protein-S-isoprenylcysteine O-methyltransferase Ste14